MTLVDVLAAGHPPPPAVVSGPLPPLPGAAVLWGNRHRLQEKQHVIPVAKHRASSVASLSGSLSTSDVAVVPCEALVVGCGVAGNAAALRLAEQGVDVTMVAAADEPWQSATYWAQGGIIYKAKDDAPELLASDIHRAGAGVCDSAAVDKLSNEGPAWVEKMLIACAEVPFHRDETGEFALTLEASHNRARILYKADHTGKAIQTSLVEAVRKHPKIMLHTARVAIELIVDDAGACRGVVALRKHDNAIECFESPFTLLATGGTGDLYVNTSNPQGARGEGVGLAARAGAKLKNMQYVQFHPTTLYIPGERRFLLTEALRGEGAILRDRQGRAFAKDYHPDGELAPRDVVARTILSEMDKQQETRMFLDISHEKPEWIRRRFPTIYEHCLTHGIDMTKEPMPVVPAAHYHCGGVEVDLHGQTSIPGLYAAGEVSCTGLHGANRLASTSLLEGLVWGCSAVDHFLSVRKVSASQLSLARVVQSSLGAGYARVATEKELVGILSTLQHVMWDSFGPLRSPSGMAIGLQELASLEVRVERLYRECVLTHETASLRNAITAAKAIGVAAATASRSVGTHFVVA